MRREVAGGLSAQLWVGGVEDLEELWHEGRSDGQDQQAPSKGGQETAAAMPTQRSARGAGTRPGTGLCCRELLWLLTAEPVSRPEAGCAWLRDTAIGRFR